MHESENLLLIDYPNDDLSDIIFSFILNKLFRLGSFLPSETTAQLTSLTVETIMSKSRDKKVLKRTNFHSQR
jgi:hypothetical protein